MIPAPVGRSAFDSLWTYRLSQCARGVADFAGALIDLVFPPACARCGSEDLPSTAGSLLCRECLRRCWWSAAPACSRCGVWLPLAGQTPLSCPRCAARSDPWPLASVWFLGAYHDIHRELVLRMKRRAHQPLVVAMGHLLGDRCRIGLAGKAVDCVVPLPVPLRRRALGTFDRCSILAQCVALRLDRPYRHILKYRRTPRKQGLLTPRQRRLNVRGAFGTRTRYAIRGRRLLLVDDVLTTGATACEAARTLLSAGAGRVDLAVVARAMPPSSTDTPPSVSRPAETPSTVAGFPPDA